MNGVCDLITLRVNFRNDPSSYNRVSISPLVTVATLLTLKWSNRYHLLPKLTEMCLMKGSTYTWVIKNHCWIYKGDDQYYCSIGLKSVHFQHHSYDHDQNATHMGWMKVSSRIYWHCTAGKRTTSEGCFPCEGSDLYFSGRLCRGPAFQWHSWWGWSILLLPFPPLILLRVTSCCRWCRGSAGPSPIQTQLHLVPDYWPMY